MNGDRCCHPYCRATGQVVLEGRAYCMEHFGQELERRYEASLVALHDGNLGAWA